VRMFIWKFLIIISYNLIPNSTSSTVHLLHLLVLFVCVFFFFYK
jgi:hypothetical protein